MCLGDGASRPSLLISQSQSPNLFTHHLVSQPHLQPNYRRPAVLETFETIADGSVPLSGLTTRLLRVTGRRGLTSSRVPVYSRADREHRHLQMNTHKQREYVPSTFPSVLPATVYPLPPSDAAPKLRPSGLVGRLFLFFPPLFSSGKLVTTEAVENVEASREPAAPVFVTSPLPRRPAQAAKKGITVALAPGWHGAMGHIITSRPDTSDGEGGRDIMLPC